MTGITLLGLGPGNPSHLTREAWDVLNSADEIYLRTRQHPTVAHLPSSLDIHSFDDLYAQGRDFDEVYAQIVEKVLELGKRPQGVVYAVPGHPFVAEATCPEISRLAREQGYDLHIVEGLSFLEPVFSALGLDPCPRLTLFDALELSQVHTPLFPPDTPVLIAQIYSQLVAAEVKMTLLAVYPEEHPVCLVHSAGTIDQIIEELHLYQIDRSRHIGLLTVLYVPPLGQRTSFESFQEIVARLRAPDGCPWDREQTHASLRMHMLEEAYEVLAALDSGDPTKLAEELGDLLLQIVLNAQIAMEAGEFTMADVLKNIHTKIINRHPHVFADLKVDGVANVLTNWERLKHAERQANGASAEGLLEGVPLALPSLTQAQEYQDRAARVGFDWPAIEGVLDKIVEEIQEVRQTTNNEQLVDEVGDLLFALVNLARWKQIDAESALRGTNVRFKRRFAYVEKGASAMGRSLSDLSLDEMESLWQAAKHQGL